MKKFLRYLEGHETVYITIWGMLLVLTILTVWVSYHNFGIMNIVVAMLVATIKGSLVCLYFMHLKYDNKTNQVVFISAFVFLAIFVGLVGSDVFFRPSVRYPESSGHLAHAAFEDLSQSTPELVKRGQELFKVHCIACHALGYASGKFKSETSSQEIYETIVKGLSDVAMPSFSDLGEKERWALTHYVDSLKK